MGGRVIRTKRQKVGRPESGTGSSLWLWAAILSWLVAPSGSLTGQPLLSAKMPRLVQEELRAMDRAVEDRQWENAVSRLVALLREAKTEWVVEEPGRVVGFRAHCAKKISAWPEEARSLYQEAVAIDIREALKDAKTSEQPTIVMEALWRFPLNGWEGVVHRLGVYAGRDEGRAIGGRMEQAPMYVPLGVIQEVGDHAWTVGDYLAVVDKIGRIRVYHPTSLLIQEIMPPAQALARPQYAGRVLIAQDEGETVHVGYTASTGSEPWGWWVGAPLSRPRQDTSSMFKLLSVRSPFVSGASPAPLEWALGFEPSVLQARHSDVWAAGVRSRVGSLEPVVARLSPENKTVLWETTLGGMVEGVRPAVTAALSPEGEMMGVMVGDSHLALMHAESGDIQWMISLSLNQQDPVKAPADNFQMLFQQAFGQITAPPPVPAHPAQLIMTESSLFFVSSSGESLVAVSRTDGKVLWTYAPASPKGGLVIAGTAPPAPQVPGAPRVAGTAPGIVIVQRPNGLVALRADTGQVEWKYQAKAAPTGQPLVTGGTVLASFGNEVVQLKASTGAAVKSWERGSSAPCVFRATGRFLYLVTPDRIQTYVNEGDVALAQYVVAGGGAGGSENELLASVAWARGEPAAALSLAADWVNGSAGWSRRIAEQLLARWIRTAAQRLAGTPSADQALEMFKRSVKVVNGPDRAALWWELGTMYEALGMTLESSEAYQTVLQDGAASPLIETAPGVRINARRLAAMRLERLAGAIVPPPSEWEGGAGPLWHVSNKGTSATKAAVAGAVMAVLEKGGLLRGFGVKDGVLLWERRIAYGGQEGGVPSGEAIQRQVNVPGGGIIQIQGGMMAQIFINMNGQQQTINAGGEAVTPATAAGDLIAVSKGFVVSTVDGLWALESETGSVRWQKMFDRPVPQAPKLMVCSTLLAAVWAEGGETRLMAVDPVQGDVVWRDRGALPWRGEGVSPWSPSMFHPMRPVAANMAAVGPFLVLGEGMTVLARDIATGKKIWPPKQINLPATFLPDGGVSPVHVVMADPWGRWDQTAQLLPVQVETGEPLAVLSLPPRSRLISATKSAFIILRADPYEIAAIRRVDQAIVWRCAVPEGLLTEGLYWCDGEKAGYQHGQAVKVIRLEDGKELLSAPIKRGVKVSGMWIQDHVVAIATSTDFRVYTLGFPKN